MIKKLISVFFIFIVLLFTLNVKPSYAGDGDKVLHAGVSFVISTVAYNFYINKTDMTDKQARVAAFLTTLAVGVVKETVDSKFDGDDLAFDALGAGAGVALGFKF